MKHQCECSEPFLLVAGVSKAGTTFIFDCLESHPEIDACSIKEPRFFIPVEYEQAKSGIRYGVNKIDDYLALFQNKPNAVKVEASSNYFGCPGSETLIARELTSAKAVISLREPISRIVSCYQMALSRCWIPPDLSFDDYVLKLLNDTPIQGYGWRILLEEGLYSRHLRRWISILGDERILVVWASELNSSPLEVIRDISRFAGIDPDFYDGYSFQKSHQTVAVRGGNLRYKFTAWKRDLWLRAGGESRFLKWYARVRRITTPLMRRLLYSPAPRIKVKYETLGTLYEYYRQDVEELASLLNREVPWANVYKTDSVDELLHSSSKLSISS